MVERPPTPIGLEVPSVPPEAGAELLISPAAPPAATGADPQQDPIPDSGKKTKKKKKDKKRKLPKEQREFKPRDRYRALNEAYETGQDLLEFGDRKVRFGLVVIGAINLVVFGAASRLQSVASIPVAWRPWIFLYMAIYAVVLVYGVRYAISALRPRIQPTTGNTARADGLHFYEDILRRPYADFEKAWLNIPIGELSTLLARQIYSLAHINRSKFSALQRMYASINLMVMMAGGLLVIAALGVLRGADGAKPEVGNESAVARGAAPDFTSREYKLMLLPERFADGQGRATDETIKRAIAAYWAMLGAEIPATVRVRTAEIDQRVMRGPARHRLVQFIDSSLVASDADCKGAPGQAFFYDCKGLVLRSRIAVKPFDPGRGFEIDDQVTPPVEITLKSRSAANLSAALDLHITAASQAAAAPLFVDSKVEKDMTVGRTTYGQSCTVQMSLGQARALFSGTSPKGPAIAVPQDLNELRRLFSAPQLARAENRPIVAIKDYAAYEQVYRVPDAIEFPDGFFASMSMTFWYDMKKELKVVEASWRIERTRKDIAQESFRPVVVGSAEQFLDHVVGVSQRLGWFSSEAQKKKTQALSAASE